MRISTEETVVQVLSWSANIFMDKGIPLTAKNTNIHYICMLAYLTSKIIVQLSIQRKMQRAWHYVYFVLNQETQIKQIGVFDINKLKELARTH